MEAPRPARAEQARRLLWVPDRLGSVLMDGADLAWPSPDWLRTNPGALSTASLRCAGVVPGAYDAALVVLGPVEVLPWDWRTGAAGQVAAVTQGLRDWLGRGPVAARPVILAHAWGGLLVWLAILRSPGLSEELRTRGARVLMIGLPWQGDGRESELAAAQGPFSAMLRRLGQDPSALAEDPAPLRQEIERGWPDCRAGHGRYGGPVELHLVMGTGVRTWTGQPLEGDGRVPSFRSPLEPGMAPCWPPGVGRWRARASHEQLLNDPGVLAGIRELAWDGHSPRFQHSADPSSRFRALVERSTDYRAELSPASLARFALGMVGRWPPPPCRPLSLTVSLAEAPEPALEGGLLELRTRAVAWLRDADTVGLDMLIDHCGVHLALAVWVEAALLADIDTLCFCVKQAHRQAAVRAELGGIGVRLGLALPPDREILIEEGVMERGIVQTEVRPPKLRVHPIPGPSGINWVLDQETAGQPRFYSVGLDLPPQVLAAWPGRELVLVLDADELSAHRWELELAPLSLHEVLIRQLGVDGEVPTRPSGAGRALIAFEENQLAHARREAELVAYLLEQAGLEVTLLKGRTFESLQEALRDPRGWEVVHIAAHGELGMDDPHLGALVLVDAEGRPRRLGVELLPPLPPPALVFLNACHLGATVQTHTVQTQTSQDLRPMARQLMRQGTRCFLGAAWAVGDRAALTFAEVFYRTMLGGQDFGRSVVAGRRAAQTTADPQLTWAAYQAYGDPRARPIRDEALPAPVSWAMWKSELEDLRARPGDGARLLALVEELDRPGMDPPIEVREAAVRGLLVIQRPELAAFLLASAPALAELRFEAQGLAAVQGWDRLPHNVGLAPRLAVAASYDESISGLRDQDTARALETAIGLLTMGEGRQGLAGDPNDVARLLAELGDRLVRQRVSPR